MKWVKTSWAYSRSASLFKCKIKVITSKHTNLLLHFFGLLNAIRLSNEILLYCKKEMATSPKSSKYFLVRISVEGRATSGVL